MTSLARNPFLGISNIHPSIVISLIKFIRSFQYPTPSLKSMLNSSQSLSFSSFDPLGHAFRSLLSYNGSVMLAALISLLLVTIFVVLLHIYAKWFLTQARHQGHGSIAVSQVLGQPRLHHFHPISFGHTPPARSPTKGLDASVISTIPLFIYVQENQCRIGLECVICLSLFEENEIGRRLPECKHVFHVECIDMWLHSHSNCPICRAPVVVHHENTKSSSEFGENELQIVISGLQQ